MRLLLAMAISLPWSTLGGVYPQGDEGRWNAGALWKGDHDEENQSNANFA